MSIHSKLALLITASVLALPVLASASTLSVSCNGTPSASNIVWSASTSGGVTPIALIWGNGATSTTQTISETPGTYSMTLQATDASSTIATSTCSATVPTASGSSVTDQITALLNQIAALKTQLAQLIQQQITNNNNTSGNATTTPNGCFSFNRNLSEGDQGMDVEDLQKTLASDPSVFPSGMITGFFGRMTEDGVKKFQEKHGILSTGFFGSKSRTFLEDQCVSGDKNKDGIPDSIEQEDNQQQMESEHTASTTTSNMTQEGDHGGNGEHNDN